MTTEVRMDNDALAAWLDIATRKLSTASAARVRKELQEHVESAREDASAAGAAGTDARRTALESLGNAKTVNRRYRRVLLTAWEARLGLIQFRGRFDYAARAAPRRSNSAGLIWPRVECRRCWL